MLVALVVIPAQVNANPTTAEMRQRIAELQLALSQLQAQVAAQRSQGQTQPPTHFPDLVQFCQTNASIRLLQSILATDSAIYPEGLVTGSFGTPTQAALTRFQGRFGLTQSGKFDDHTRFIFDQLLTRLPYTNQPGYLRGLEVRNMIIALVAEAAWPDLVVAGRVVLRDVPIISGTTPSSDVATMQRILRTDPSLYPAGLVTGLVDSATRQAVIRLRAKYNIPFVPGTSPATVNDIINAETISLFRNLLTVNNAATIRSDLLSSPTTRQQSTNLSLANQSIRSVRMIIDHARQQTEVVVTYQNGAVDRFILNTTGPVATLETQVATRINRPVTSFASVISRQEINVRALTRIIFTAKSPTDLHLDLQYANGTREAFAVPAYEIDDFVQAFYDGDYGAYRRDFEMSMERARRGERAHVIYRLIEDILNQTQTVREIENVLELNR